MSTKDRPLAVVAKYGTFEEFGERLATDDVDSVSDTGLPVVVAAATNNDLDARGRMFDALLEAGVDASATSRPEGAGVLHILFSRPSDGIAQVAELLPRLIDAGADINLRDEAGWRPLALLAKSRHRDADLAPLYDAIFAVDGLELTEPANAKGQSVLEYARGRVNRKELAGRVEAYLAERGIDLPEDEEA